MQLKANKRTYWPRSRKTGLPSEDVHKRYSTLAICLLHLPHPGCAQTQRHVNCVPLVRCWVVMWESSGQSRMIFVVGLLLPYWNGRDPWIMVMQASWCVCVCGGGGGCQKERTESRMDREISCLHTTVQRIALATLSQNNGSWLWESGYFATVLTPYSLLHTSDLLCWCWAPKCFDLSLLFHVNLTSWQHSIYCHYW